MGENGSSEPNSDILERLTLSIQSRLDIDRERQTIERDNQKKETINRRRCSHQGEQDNDNIEKNLNTLPCDLFTVVANAGLTGNCLLLHSNGNSPD